MKLSILSVVAIVMIATAPSVGCNPATEKTDNSNSKAENASLVEAVQPTAAPDSITKAEWAEFKKYSESEIEKNEVTIDKLKLKMKESGKSMDSLYVQQINTLEKNNKDMKRRISDFEKDQSNWETFKREFNHDMEAIGNALKDLTVNNKK